ncbi:MAG: hypothetical protein F4Z31_07650 [Gemmatimonadetes bacterium]|nr:hypothetical protein [Gemmatimonadota bacterium]MYJ10063.1 hypothetical protein [Gemmatimonadota bacterium]
MPNWCQNELSVYGPKDQVREIYDLIVNELEDDKIAVTFDRVIPMPKILQKVTTGGTKIDGEYVTTWVNEGEWPDVKARKLNEGEQLLIDAIGYPSWYEWAIDNWGTKWDACESRLITPFEVWEDEAEFAVAFDTAWSPPEPFFNALQERFENVRVGGFYREDGLQFAGYF